MADGAGQLKTGKGLVYGLQTAAAATDREQAGHVRYVCGAICSEEETGDQAIARHLPDGVPAKVRSVIVRWLMPGEAEGTDQEAHRILTPLRGSRPVVGTPLCGSIPKSTLGRFLDSYRRLGLFG